MRSLLSFVPVPRVLRPSLIWMGSWLVAPP